MDGRPVIPVGTHDLACLEPEEYAALALYMQKTAQGIEAALMETRDNVNEYRLRTSLEYVSTVTTSFAAGGGTVMPDGRAANGIDWSGATVLGGGSVTTATTAGGSISFVPARSGWYDIGAYTNAIAAGAVTVGSERVLYVLGIQTPDLPATDSTVIFQERVTDTNTGGEFLNVSGLAYFVGGRAASVQVLVSHANAASNLVMQIGSKVWIAYYGPRNVIVANA